MNARVDISIKEGMNGYFFVRINGHLLASFKHLPHAQFFVKHYQELPPTETIKTKANGK